jgi:hypothetical protein
MANGHVKRGRGRPDCGKFLENRIIRITYIPLIFNPFLYYKLRRTDDRGRGSMQSANDLLRFQREQYRHDMRNHSDILGLPKHDRLKHYGLHFAKYVGRLARGADESKSFERTVVDTFLVSLSAANTLHQKLSSVQWPAQLHGRQIDPVYVLADAAGRFADACEKIDHVEEFIPLAQQANVDIVKWVINIASERQMKLEPAIQERRRELVARQFYIED